MRQLLFAAVLGLAAMLALSRRRFVLSPHGVPSDWLLLSGPWFCLLVPGIVRCSKTGSETWISLGGPFRLQPSEFCKPSL